MIPRSTIDSIIASTSLVDVIKRYVPELKKAGKDFTACCPFHEETSPSFNVSEEKQVYHCFGCGAKGDAINFIADFENISFPVAAERLAKEAGITIEREGAKVISKQEKEEYREQFSVLEKATQHYTSNFNSNSNPQAVADIKARGLSEETIKKFRLGVANNSWTDTLDFLGGFKNKDILQAAGLAIHVPKEETPNNSTKFYSRFRNGVIFPIQNAKGSTVSFAVRRLSTEDREAPKDGYKKRAKYINGSDSLVFTKNKTLYGLHQALSEEKSVTTFNVVEGYYDVLASDTHDVVGTVAAMGTAISEENIRMLARHAGDGGTINFIFDADVAGRDAAVRAMESSLPIYDGAVNYSFVFLPDGEDPDTFLNKYGKDIYQDYISQKGYTLSNLMLSVCRRDMNMQKDEDRARFFDRASVYLDKMPRSSIKQRLAQVVSERSGIQIKEILPITMNIAPNINNFDIAASIAQETEKRLGIPAGQISINFEAPKIQPTKNPVITSFDGLNVAKEYQARAANVMNALKLDSTVIKGFTLQHLYRKAKQGDDGTREISEAIISDYLTRGNVFETQVNQIAIDLRAIRDCCNEMINTRGLSPEQAQQMKTWSDKCNDRVSDFRSLAEIADEVSITKAINTTCDSINVICSELSKDMQKVITQKESKEITAIAHSR
jgi:DNA primase